MLKLNKQKPTTSLDMDDNVTKINEYELEGSLINQRYMVGSMIGRGGQGKVYKAYDMSNGHSN